MHDSRMIANEFIQIAAKNGNAFTPMQLLKLVYIAHGWMLGLYNIPLIKDRIEAWKFGPVIPKLYHATKQSRGNHVLNQIVCDPDDKLVPIEQNLIEQIYNLYGSYAGVSLSNLTHQSGTPWDRVFVPNTNNIAISNDIIEEYYKSLAARANAS